MGKMSKELEDIKTLVVIGGLPCLVFSISSLIIYKFFPDSIYGMLFVGILSFVVVIISITILVKIILNKL